jgi:hypothetical protein
LRDRHVREQTHGLNRVADAAPQFDRVDVVNVVAVDDNASLAQRYEAIHGS